ncbi:MAG: NUDIX domain-containing protein [Roseiarcus sp.]|jgi:predicted NUDIX family NTP pyrophosphohydrolase
MTAASAGILLYHCLEGRLLVLLVHPGGPFWRHRDLGAWSIPKGERRPGEDGEAAARREFAEELGDQPSGALQPIGAIKQRGGKHVEAFALEGDFDVAGVRSNTFQISWPPGSGRTASFPEIDRAAWFTLPAAREKILASQAPLLDRLEQLCADRR